MKEKIVDVALIIATYCTIIWMQENKKTEPNCPEMLKKYKRAAERFPIPHDEDGFVDTEMLYDQLDVIAKRICKGIA